MHAFTSPPPCLSRKTLVAVFILVTLVLAGGGYWYYKAQANAIQLTNYENIAAIAKMKVRQIQQWRKERFSDIRRVANDPAFKREAGEITRHSDIPAVREELRKTMDAFLEGEVYSILLVAPDGKILLATKDEEVLPLVAATRQALDAALVSQEPVLSDFFEESASHVHIDVIEAVRDSEGKTVGAVILRCKAEDYLYPLIQSWPVPSRSAETLLVRREGERVVFLNQPRYHSITTLPLRFSLKEIKLPAVQAAIGRVGMFVGEDYRKVPVLASLCAIPETPWFMVAKVDEEEILAEARYWALSIGGIVGALILLAAAVTALVYRRQQAGVLRELLEAEREQRKFHEQFRIILYSIGDAVITTDIEGRVQTMNPVAEELTGWTEAEANNRPLDEVFRIVHQETRAKVDNPVHTVIRTGVGVKLANHTVIIARDGTEHAIADSAAPIRDESGVMSGVVLVVSDVSEQYRVREALRRSERDYQMLFAGMIEGFAVHEILCDASGKPVDYRFLSMNPAFEKMTQLRAADILGRSVREVMPQTEEAWIERYGKVALTGEPMHFEEYSRVLGCHFKVTAFRPQPGQFATVFEDITERKAAEARIARLTQLYAALSQCNQAIVHCGSVEELLPKICRDVVEYGGMKMAWIGMLDQATGKVRPAASYGNGSEYLEGILISVDAQDPQGRGPTGTAIRENELFWCQDFLSDPRTAPWHERAARYHWAASAAIPLCLKGKPIGAITIYSDKIHSLDEEMRALLAEMGTDISFAFDNFAREEERKQAEEKAAGLSAIVESSDDAIIGKTPDGIVTSWNKGAERVYGYTEQEMIGHSVSLLVPPGLEDEIPDILARLKKGEHIEHYETRRQRKDGRIIQIAISLSPILNAEGEVVAASTIVRDITERKRVEEQMRLQSGALEAAANAIVITDSKGVIEWTNAAFTAYTGYSAAEAIGQNPRLLKSDKQDPAYYEDLWKTIRAGEVWHGEMVNRRKDGSLYSEEMIITPMKDAHGAITHFIAVKQDITERKRMEENLLRTQRMESIGTLASGVAHDLNNILTPISLSADMLRTAEQPEARECLIATIEECAQRGASIVNQVLTFARGAKGERIPLHLNRLVRDMEKIMNETFPKNITIASSIPSDLCSVTGDPTQIHQVLLNLCINARDAMPNGGDLLISVENKEVDESFAAMAPDAKEGKYVMLVVSDTGTGIPGEIIGKIFDPFFTTKEVGKGTGLGLSTVIGIIRSHGGFVMVESEEGKGSQFQLFLPAQTGDKADPAAPVPMEMPQGNGETVLVVDDEAFIAKVTSMVLEKNGYKVLTAANGNEALALYKEHAPAIKIVITDVMMPGMDGVSLAGALQTINPQVRIIASTGQATETRQKELRAIGVHWILHKPYDARKLLSSLHAAIHPENAKG